MRLPLLSLLAIITSLLNYDAKAQCNYEFTHTIEVVKAKTSYNLRLKFIKGEQTNKYRFVLYDLRMGKTVDEKSLSFTRKEDKIVFLNLRPSIYTIYIFYPGCEEPISLGGISGIKTFGL